MINKIIKVVLLTVLVVGFATISQAQVGPGGGIGGGSGTPGGPGAPGAPGGTPVPQDNAVPFDGGLSLILLAAGAGMGAKRRKIVMPNP